jgi:hypothetical protein
LDWIGLDWIGDLWELRVPVVPVYLGGKPVGGPEEKLVEVL